MKKAQQTPVATGLFFRDANGSTVSVGTPNEVFNLLGVKIEQLRALTIIITQALHGSGELDETHLGTVALMAQEYASAADKLYDLYATTDTSGGTQ